MIGWIVDFAELFASTLVFASHVRLMDEGEVVDDVLTQVGK
jgi:hypothetical protein